MGITSLSLQRINRYIHPNSKILLIGCQNIFSPENYGEIAQDYFRSLGHTVKSIDVYECNGADVMDLRDELHFERIYNLVLQHGTVEHVNGSLYWPFRNMHEACEDDGIMIHENPKKGNWPDHGEHYFTKDFYFQLANWCGYGIMEIDEEPAMGNIIDGWNVSCVLKKGIHMEFLSEDRFNEIYAKYIFAK
jgi:hypothetical protein